MLREVISRPEVKAVLSETASRVNHTRWHVARGRSSPGCSLCIEEGATINHKVASVEACGHEDVYDITVDRYHNFAINAGIFVHNCEDDSLGYLVNGHLMSDFVLPSWFNPAGVAPFTFRRTIDAPLQLATGGYIGVRQLPNGMWTQKFAFKEFLDAAKGNATPRQVKGPTSRTMRRFQA